MTLTFDKYKSSETDESTSYHEHNEAEDGHTAHCYGNHDTDGDDWMVRSILLGRLQLFLQAEEFVESLQQRYNFVFLFVLHASHSENCKNSHNFWITYIYKFYSVRENLISDRLIYV